MDEQKLSYNDLIYLIDQAEKIEEKIIEALKKADMSSKEEREKYYEKIKELESKISNINNQIKAFLEK